MEPSQQMSSGALQSILKQEGSAEAGSGEHGGAYDGFPVMTAALITGLLTFGKFKIAAGKTGKFGILGSESNMGACFALGSACGSLLPDMSTLGLPAPIMEFMKFLNPQVNDDIGRTYADSPLTELPFAPPQTGEGSASNNMASSGGGGNAYSVSGPPQASLGGSVSMAALGSLVPDSVGRGGGVGIGAGMGM